MAGILLVSKIADFSANPVNHAGLYTTVTSGLQSLHETRRNASKAIHNSAPGKAPGSIIGAPTFSATSASVTPANSVVFGSAPVSGGLTVAVAFKQRNGGSSETVFGFIPGSSTTRGGCYLNHYNRRLSLEGYTYPAGTVAPLSGYAQASCFLDMDASYDNAYELFFIQLENNVNDRIVHQKSAAVGSASAVGKDFCFDNAAPFRTCYQTATLAHDVALFGHWSRVLTSIERATFYAEMQAQFLALGLTL